MLIADKDDAMKINLSSVSKDPGQHYLSILINTQTCSISLPEAGLEILADEIGYYLDKLQQEKLAAVAAATDKAIQEMLSCV
jgi:hypothetical protein